MTTMGKSLQSEQNGNWLLLQSVFRYLSSSSREIGPANPYFAGGASTTNTPAWCSSQHWPCSAGFGTMVPKGCRASRQLKRHLCPVPFPLPSLLSHWAWGWDNLCLAAWSGRTLSLAKSMTASRWSRELQQSLELQARGSSSWSTPGSSAQLLSDTHTCPRDTKGTCFLSSPEHTACCSPALRDLQ